MTSSSLLRGSGSSIERQERVLIATTATTTTTATENDTLEEESSSRQLDEVERVGDLSCRVTTSIETEYNGRDSAVGTMFTLEVKDRLELVGLEFNVFERASDLSVLVYYQEGDFSGSTDNPDQWSLLADTTAQLSPDRRSAIVPAADFSSVELQKGIYSLYLHFASTDVFKYKSADSLIGESFDSNDLFDLKVGVTLTDPDPFPKSFDQASNFNGVFHYRKLQSCTSAVTTTKVDLQFAINADPTQELQTDLAEAVEGAVAALFTLELVRYEDNHMLALERVESNFQGRSQSLCPNEYDRCSLIFTTLHLTHLETVDASEIETAILKNDDTFRGPIEAKMSVETEYVGDPILQGEYLFTITGVPSGQIMNAIQKRYFERIATDFFRQFSEEIPLHRVEVTDEKPVVEEVADAGERQLQQMLRKGYSPPLPRQQRRNLSGETQIVATVYGQGKRITDILEGVLETVDAKEQRFVQELALQQYRPGEINDESDFGAHFANVAGIVVGLVPSDFYEVETPDAPSESNQYQFLIYVCYAVLGLAVLGLLYRIYKDCCAPPDEDKNKKESERKNRRFGPMSFRRRKNHPSKDEAKKDMKKDEGRADSHKTSSTKSSISSHDKGLKNKKKKKKKKNGSASSVDHSVASLDKGLDKKKKKGAAGKKGASGKNKRKKGAAGKKKKKGGATSDEERSLESLTGLPKKKKKSIDSDASTSTKQKKALDDGTQKSVGSTQSMPNPRTRMDGYSSSSEESSTDDESDYREKARKALSLKNGPPLGRSASDESSVESSVEIEFSKADSETSSTGDSNEGLPTMQRPADYDSAESSDESDFEPDDFGSDPLPGQPTKFLHPNKHVSKSSSDDESSGNKFIHPNKHVSRSLSDDESSGNKFIHPNKHPSRSFSDDESPGNKFIHPNKHPSRSFSDDEKPGNTKFIHPNKHPSRSFSDDEKPGNTKFIHPNKHVPNSGYLDSVGNGSSHSKPGVLNVKPHFDDDDISELSYFGSSHSAYSRQAAKGTSLTKMTGELVSPASVNKPRKFLQNPSIKPPDLDSNEASVKSPNNSDSQPKPPRRTWSTESLRKRESPKVRRTTPGEFGKAGKIKYEPHLSLDQNKLAGDANSPELPPDEV